MKRKQVPLRATVSLRKPIANRLLGSGKVLADVPPPARLARPLAAHPPATLHVKAAAPSVPAQAETALLGAQTRLSGNGSVYQTPSHSVVHDMHLHTDVPSDTTRAALPRRLKRHSMHTTPFGRLYIYPDGGLELVYTNSGRHAVDVNAMLEADDGSMIALTVHLLVSAGSERVTELGIEGPPAGVSVNAETTMRQGGSFGTLTVRQGEYAFSTEMLSLPMADTVDTFDVDRWRLSIVLVRSAAPVALGCTDRDAVVSTANVGRFELGDAGWSYRPCAAQCGIFVDTLVAGSHIVHVLRVVAPSRADVDSMNFPEDKISVLKLTDQLPQDCSLYIEELHGTAWRLCSRCADASFTTTLKSNHSFRAFVHHDPTGLQGAPSAPVQM